MDIFFDDKKAPEHDDCCVHGGEAKIRIACVFDLFPSQLVIDAQHPTDLLQEHLLNTQGHLEVVKTYTCSAAGKGKLDGVFARALHPTADGYGDLLSLTNAKLKQRAKHVGADVSDANQSINTALRRAIWNHASDLRMEETEVELKDEAAEAIWDQLKKHLPVFALFKSDRASTDQDEEAQDPMRAAIKEAMKARESELNEITEQVKREVQDIADRTVEKIREMNPDLARQLTPRVKNKNWDSLFSVTLAGEENIPINKRGSGTRRLILLNFFRAKAEKDAEGKTTDIIYAIEEPETSQHPNNQKLLTDAFLELAERPSCQVFLTTHTPVLARRFHQHSLRFVVNGSSGPEIRTGDDDDALKEIVRSLGVLPDHNIKAFLGVEGGNDIVFLRTISAILCAAGEPVPDLSKAEDEGRLVFVPLGGSNIELWISRLRTLNRPEFYLMDRDTEPPAEPKSKDAGDKLKARGCTVWHTSRRELENYIHSDAIKAKYPTYAGTVAAFEDVPHLFAKAVHEASESGEQWAAVIADQRKLDKKISRAKKRLNAESAASMTPDLLTKVDSQDEVRSWLKAIGTVL
ncbi:MAG: AAA family ATPase [Bacteroidota bacterium]